MPTRVYLETRGLGLRSSRSLLVVLAALVALILILAAVFRNEADPGELVDAPAAPARPVPYSSSPEQLLPVVHLCVSGGAPEANWSAALAERLAGSLEYPVSHGRVDVLTDRYSIEVDRLPKWHEGIGQALHYAEATEKIPLLALIIPDPQTASHSSLLDEIDRVALRSGVRIVLLTTSTGC